MKARPVPEDPAGCILQLIAGSPACFLKDDTDEDAFPGLRGQGLGILLAEALRPTLATARLTGPEQARRP
jgi:hypothetical protein